MVSLYLGVWQKRVIWFFGMWFALGWMNYWQKPWFYALAMAPLWFIPLLFFKDDKRWKEGKQ